MYNESDLRTLLQEARDGGDNEYMRFVKAVYDVGIRILSKNQWAKELIDKRYNDRHAFFNKYIHHVCEKAINKYDDSKGRGVASYISNGFIYKIRDEIHDHQIKRKSNKWNRYTFALNDYYDKYPLLDRVMDEEDFELAVTGLEDVFNGLPLKEQIVIQDYMAGKPCRQTGKVIGLTFQRVHQLRTDAFFKLRIALKRKGIEHA